MSIRHEREARLANGFDDQRGYAIGGIVVSKEAADWWKGEDADRYSELPLREMDVWYAKHYEEGG